MSGRVATRGILVERFGAWRDARLDDVELDPPGPGEILIEVEAAALNFPDLLMIEGRYQHKPDLPFVAGRDVAGRILSLGPDVTGLAEGQRVAAQPRTGAFAGHVVAPVSHVFPIPENLDAAKAAAAGTVFTTAVAALDMRGDMKAGERVMVTGAAGGVGLAGLQYAALKGAEIVALVSSDAKEEAVRRHGAHHVVRIDRIETPRDGLRAALAEQGLDGVDIVLDVVGGDWFDAAIRCVRPEGRVLVVGFTSGRIPEVKVNYLLLKNISLVGVSLAVPFERHGDFLQAAMRDVHEAIAAGRLDPLVSETFPLDRFQEAASRIAERRAIGKIVLVPERVSRSPR